MVAMAAARAAAVTKDDGGGGGAEDDGRSCWVLFGLSSESGFSVISPSSEKLFVLVILY